MQGQLAAHDRGGIWTTLSRDRVCTFGRHFVILTLNLLVRAKQAH